MRERCSQSPAGLGGEHVRGGRAGDPVAALALGGVERGVGPGEQVRGGDAARRAVGDADAERHRMGERGAGERRPERLGEDGRAVQVGVGQDQRELLAADPGEEVRRAARGARLARERAQGVVAGRVAVTSR